MSAASIFYLYLSTLAAYAACEAVLAWLNLRCIARHAAAVPAFLQERLDPETYKRCVAYSAARMRLHLAGHAVQSAFLLGVVLSGFLGVLDAAVTRIVGAGYAGGLLYLLALTLIFDLVALPFELYSTFVIEERFGFNKMTLKLWLSDKVKGLLIGALLLSPLVLAVLWLMRAAGSVWWLYALALIALFQLAVIYIYPAWIAPLFNRFTPLADLQLRERVLALGQRLGFSISEVFVMDGSRRSTHANAYFTGFGRHKRVVLFDTLCTLLDADQLLSVLAHEIGHQQSRHVTKSVLCSLALAACGLWLLSLVLSHGPLYAAFGIAQPSNHAALALMIFAGGPLLYFVTPLFAMLSRRFEYQADRFASAAVGSAVPLEDALVELSKQSLSNYTPHPLYAFVHYSHPPLRERLSALRRQAARP